jgi:microcystin-dependent protein
MAITPQGVPSEPGLTYVNVARSLPFQYTFRGDDITEFNPATRDLFENRDRELELKLIDIGGVIPVGGLTMFGGVKAAIPYNYLLCDGRTLDTTEFANLFNVIGYRYGGSGASFILPNFTTRIPIGIIGAPTLPATQATGKPSAVDVHTHTVNSSLALGTLNTHTHSGGVLTAGSVNSSFTAGNAQNHTHGVVGNTGNASDSHQHTYYKPNTGANSSTGFSGSVHTHAMLFNSSGSNTTIGLNSSFTAGNTNTSITAPGAPNATINTALTAGNASTINTSTAAHTHTIDTTEVLFIIRYE